MAKVKTKIKNATDKYLDYAGLNYFFHKLVSYILKLVYPVGTIYLSKVNTCAPALAMDGTTWQALEPNRMLRIMNNTSLGGGFCNFNWSTDAAA